MKKAIFIFMVIGIGIAIAFKATCYGYAFDITPNITQITNSPLVQEFEPSVAISGPADNPIIYVIWYEAINTTTGKLILDKSTDFGRTWGAHQKIIQDPISRTNKKKLYLSNISGRIFIDLGYTIKVSDDMAETFADLSMPAGFGPRYFALNRKGDKVYIFGVYLGSIGLIKSFDGGMTFSEPSRVNNLTLPQYAKDINLELTDNGQLVYLFCNGYYRDPLDPLHYSLSVPYVITSTDYGVSFAAPRALWPWQYCTSNLRSTIGENGEPFIVYDNVDQRGGMTAPHEFDLTFSLDNGANFLSAPISDAEMGSSIYGIPAISVDNNGLVHAAFGKAWGNGAGVCYDKGRKGEPAMPIYFSTDQVIGGYGNNPVIAVTPEGDKACIIYEMQFYHPYLPQFDIHDLYCATFSTNYPPHLDWISDKTVTEGQRLQFRLSASDPDGDTLTFSSPNLPTGASLDEDSGLFTWTPAHEQIGEYHVRFIVSDGSSSVEQTVKITVAYIPQPPQLGTVNPASGTFLINQPYSFTTTYADPNGVTDIRFVYFLINTGINGANCFYGNYNQITNTLWLKDDANFSWIGGVNPGTAGAAISNSYCTLDCANSTVSKSGDTLTINWKIIFKYKFVTKVPNNGYLMANDRYDLTAGWTQKAANYRITNTPPSVELIPTAGPYRINHAYQFNSRYSDMNTSQDIRSMYLLISDSSTSFTNCFYAYYDQSSNTLWLRDDANQKWIGGVQPGSARLLSNSYCSLDCRNTIITKYGDRLIGVSWKIIFKDVCVGTKSAYGRASDYSAADTGWVQRGSFEITR